MKNCLTEGSLTTQSECRTYWDQGDMATGERVNRSVLICSLTIHLLIQHTFTGKPLGRAPHLHCGYRSE